LTRKYKKTAFSGSFAPLHKGHELVIRKAITLSESLVIGLTSDEYLRRKGVFMPYNKRKEELEKLFSKLNFDKYEIVEINGPFDEKAMDKDIEAIILTEENLDKGKKLNEIRESRGVKPLDLVVIPLVLAEDGRKISSTRIRRGEIDRNGRIIKNKVRN